MKLRQQYLSAISASICTGIFIILDKNNFEMVVIIKLKIFNFSVLLISESDCKKYRKSD